MARPSIERRGDSWTLTWETEQVGIGYERLRDTSDGLYAEIVVSSIRPNSTGLLIGPVRLNLLSSESQTRLANTLAKRDKTTDWQGMLVQGCATVAREYREPAPVVYLNRVDFAPVRYLVPYLIPEDEISMIYGDAESAKSLLALRIAASIHTGVQLPWGHEPVRRAKCLYLDWETNDRTIAARLRRVSMGMMGLGLDAVPDIAYKGSSGRRALRPLEDELPSLREFMDRERIEFTVVDSIGYALGAGESLNEDTSGRKAKYLLSQLPGTKLVIAHISKASANNPSGRSDPIGSMFFRASMRSGFEVRRSENEAEDAIDIGLYHWKSNDGRHMRPAGIHIAFHGEEAIEFSPQDINEVADLAERQSHSARILAALRKANDARTSLDISVDTGIPEPVVASTLRRMNGAAVTQVRSGGGRGNPALWGLKDFSPRLEVVG